jgi:hypothetical protein
MARDRKCGRIDQRYCGQQQHCNVLHPASFQVDESVRGRQYRRIDTLPRERRIATRFKEGTTDQYGHFTIRGVAPGKYKAFAFATAPGFDDFTDPEFMRPLESKDESVSVEENGKQTLQLKLMSDSDSPSK